MALRLRGSVTVTLEDTSDRALSSRTDPFLRRTLALVCPHWSTKIGRATSSDTGPNKSSEYNALFSSRVISRDHAMLKADPETGEIFIKDIGSMHGTHIRGRRLRDHEWERLHKGDVVTLGQLVERGTSTFVPTQVQVSFKWAICSMPPKISHNSFSAEYTDDELEVMEDEVSEGSIFGDDGVQSQHAPEPIHSRDEASVDRDASVQLVDRPTTFAVLESDMSEVISIISDDHDSTLESPDSSQVGSNAQDHDKVDREDHNSRSQYSDYDDDLPNGRFPSPEYSVANSSDNDSHYEGDDVFNGESIEVVPESVAVSARPRTASVHIAETTSSSQDSSAATTSRAARDPSPSDAAMVKPIGSLDVAPPFGQKLPGIESLGMPVAAESYLSAQSSNRPRNETAWAGHNSVLYESLPSDYCPSSIPQHLSCETSGAQGVPSAPRINTTYDTTSMDNSTQVFPRELSRKTAVALSGRKRKADDISLGDSEASSSAQPLMQTGAQDANIFPFSSANENGELPTVNPATITVVGNRTKKQKRSKHDSGARHKDEGSSFGSSAVKFLAGVAIGSVATVLGLASLPSDFFV